MRLYRSLKYCYTSARAKVLKILRAREMARPEGSYSLTLAWQRAARKQGNHRNICTITEHIQRVVNSAKSAHAARARFIRDVNNGNIYLKIGCTFVPPTPPPEYAMTPPPPQSTSTTTTTMTVVATRGWLQTLRVSVPANVYCLRNCVCVCRAFVCVPHAYPSSALALQHPLHVNESIFQRYAMGLHQLLVDGINRRRVPQIGGGFDEFQRIAGAQRTQHFDLHVVVGVLIKLTGCQV